MEKKSAISAETSAVKTDKILMADVNSKIEAPEAAGLEKKVHFKKLKKFNEKRAANSSKYSRFNSFLLFIFPVFICSMAEINQGKYVSSFFKFIVGRPTVIIFDILLTAVLFTFIISIFKKGWVAMLIHSFIYIA